MAEQILQLINLAAQSEGHSRCIFWDPSQCADLKMWSEMSLVRAMDTNDL
jgi:hypothetical protein